MIADALLGMREHSTLVGVFAFTLGALMYYTVFYRARLVPRWLSGWGIAATLLMMIACLLSLFSNSPVTGYTFLFLPILVQEMVLAGWLLVNGFRPSPLTSTAFSESSTTPGTNAATRRSAAVPTSSGSSPTATH